MEKMSHFLRYSRVRRITIAGVKNVAKAISEEITAKRIFEGLAVHKFKPSAKLDPSNSINSKTAVIKPGV